MKKLLTVFGLILALTAIAQTNNLPDSMDANKVPASEESREGELIDTRDSIDLNDTPAPLEQREEEEVLEGQSMDATESTESQEMQDM